MKRYISADIVYPEDESYTTRVHIASDPNTRPETLRKLSINKDWVVRSEVAFNPNTPVEVLSKLVDDPSEDVRVCVAQNPNTPEEALRKLSTDKDWLTRQEALKNLYKDMI